MVLMPVHERNPPTTPRPIILREGKTRTGGRKFYCNRCHDRGFIWFGLVTCPECKGDPASRLTPRPPPPGGSGSIKVADLEKLAQKLREAMAEPNVVTLYTALKILGEKRM